MTILCWVTILPDVVSDCDVDYIPDSVWLNRWLYSFRPTLLGDIRRLASNSQWSSVIVNDRRDIVTDSVWLRQWQFYVESLTLFDSNRRQPTLFDDHIVSSLGPRPIDICDCNIFVWGGTWIITLSSQRSLHVSDQVSHKICPDSVHRLTETRDPVET